MRIGLIPMAAKPYHAGHDMLIRRAAAENDKVHVFVSVSDRKRRGELTISGEVMQQIWHEYIEDSLPKNIQIEFVKIPVSKIYEKIEEAEQNNSKNIFSIYSDSKDILKYKEESLKKSAANLFCKGQIILRGIDRKNTIQISSTEMRLMLSSGKKSNFVKMLPDSIQMWGKEIFDALRPRLLSAKN